MNQKRVRTLINNLGSASPEEMKLVVVQLIEDGKTDPEKLRAALEAGIQALPVPEQYVNVKLSGVVRYDDSVGAINFIKTVKVLREVMGWGLRESKASVDFIVDTYPLLMDMHLRPPARIQFDLNNKKSRMQFNSLQESLRVIGVIASAVPVERYTHL